MSGTKRQFPGNPEPAAVEDLADPLWAQAPGETQKHYQWFCLYRDSLNRSMTRLAKEVGVNERTVKRPAQRWHWTRRVQAYEQHLEAIRKEERERNVREMEARWARRAEELREQEWAVAQSLLLKAAAMESMPIEEVTEEVVERYDDGREKRVVVHRHPVRFRAADIAKHRRVASDLGRRATGLESDRQVVEHQYNGDVAVRAVDLMSPEDRRRFLEATSERERNKIIAPYLERALHGAGPGASQGG